MQSHKLGAIWLFDEMWQEIVNSKRKFYYMGSESNGPIHAACYEKPFLVFYTEGVENPTTVEELKDFNYYLISCCSDVIDFEPIE